MEITKLKEQGLFIKTKTASFAVDCFNTEEEASPESEKANFALSTKPFLKKSYLDADKHLFCWPGEFEVQGISVTAHPIAENTVQESQPLLFVVYAETFKLCFLPELKKELHSDLIEAIGDIDLLIFSTATNEKILQNTIEEIEPKALLPFPSVEKFVAGEMLLQKLGLVKPEPAEKIVIKSKSDFSVEKMTAFLLN